MTNSYFSPQAKPRDTYVTPSTTAPFAEPQRKDPPPKPSKTNEWTGLVNALAIVNPSLHRYLDYRQEKYISEEEILGIEDAIEASKNNFGKLASSIRKSDGDEAANQLIGKSVWRQNAFDKTKGLIITNNYKNKAEALFNRKTIEYVTPNGNKINKPISHFSPESTEFKNLIQEIAELDAEHVMTMMPSQKLKFTENQANIIATITAQQVQNYNNFLIEERKQQLPNILFSGFTLYEKGDTSTGLANIQEYIEDSYSIGLSDSVSPKNIIDIAKNQAARIFEINNQSGKDGYNAAMEYLEMIGQIKHGPKQLQKNGTYKQHLLADSFGEDLLELKVKLGVQEDKIKTKAAEKLKAKEEKTMEGFVKLFSTDNDALEDLLKANPDHREFIFDQIEIYSGNRDDLFDDFNYKVGVGYYANNRRQMFSDLAAIKEQIGETFTEEDRQNYQKSYDIAIRRVSSNVGKFDTRAQRMFRQGKTILGGTGEFGDIFTEKDSDKAIQHVDLAGRINRRRIDEIQNALGLSDKDKEDKWREIQADYFESIKLINKGDYEETGTFDSAETKERKAKEEERKTGIDKLMTDYGFGLEDATKIYDEDLDPTKFDSSQEEQQQGQENKPGDWYRDDDGQIYIFQDFGKWTPSNRKGSGEEVTKPGSEEIEKEEEDTSEKNWIELLLDGLKGQDNDEVVSQLNAAKENSSESEAGLIDSILNTFMGSAAAGTLDNETRITEPEISTTGTGIQRMNTNFPTIYKIAKEIGIKFPEVVAAQFGEESDWGKEITGKNNYWGIKATQEEIDNGQSTLAWTTEEVNGKRIRIQAHFKDFPTIRDALIHYKKYWNDDYGSRKGTVNAETAEEAIKLLKANGYATNSNYESALLEILSNARDPRFGTALY